MKSLWIVLLLSVGAARMGAAAEGTDAPDGRRGLGARSSHGDLLHLFRQPDADERAFLDDLRDLGPRLAVLVGLAESLYRSRGWLEVLPPRSSGDLPALHAAFMAFLSDPAPALRRSGSASRAWAELFLDVRFLARLEVLDGWEEDARTIQRGLGLLASETDGWT